MMAERPRSGFEKLTRPGELPLGETSGLHREVSRHGWEEPLELVHREGGGIGAMKSIEKILVAVDFSEESDGALEAALGLAKAWSAELHVVHALDLRVALVAPYEIVIPPGFIDEARRTATSKLATLVEKVAAEGLSATPHLTEAPAATAIVELAKRIGADLIVMGTRGRTGLKHVLLGSVAERTLREAPCSVLTVKRALG